MTVWVGVPAGWELCMSRVPASAPNHGYRIGVRHDGGVVVDYGSVSGCGVLSPPGMESRGVPGTAQPNR